MLQLNNTTPFAARLSVMPDEEGIESIYVNVKGGFKIGRQWTLLEKQSPPQDQDCYWGDPSSSSLRYASDIHPGKPATDVVMIGSACAVDMRPVQQLDVALSVAGVTKTIRVYGDRAWEGGVIGSPATFQSMPLLYEHAFGGTLYKDEKVVSSETRNPVGRGYSGGRGRKTMEGELLPNLEDPRCLIRSIDDQPEPACFGFRAPHWHPRATFAGTYDANWQLDRAPYLPLDFDKRFLSAAHPDLVCNGFLRGGEPVQITSMNPLGTLEFDLPRVQLAGRVIGGASETLGFNLETVLLEPNELQLFMVWKAKLRCERGPLKIKCINVSLHR